ncbi:MAG: SUMF1/EgtB/PvdO family nonheme iron enzyme [Polyangiaceae bacterium]|nr:SUMF1/EgtB/PvdO family nonheme iron enzyme [Polyangiaceae bacterium]
MHDSTSLEDESGVVRTRAPEVAPALPGRYEDLGVVARGAFGEVRRVRDTELDRVLAMKVLHAELASRPWIRRRFLTEVRITAQLQHPGVVPLYDHGELSDGRLWYVMKEVRGSTLGTILHELFEASSPEGFGTTASGWTFRRVVDVVARVAQTVAHAHRMGVVHRDLKPENVMVGELGEVMVMDWGLARRLARAAREEEDEVAGALEPAVAGDLPAALTRHGDVLGTPAYMPPEQALGARDLHGPASDVYALGAILYHLLTGRPPYDGGGIDVIKQIVAGPPPKVREAARGGPPVPADLVRAAERAIEREIADRCSAEQLAGDVLAWLDGARRREEALVVVNDARALEPEIAALRAQASEKRREAQARLDGVRPFDPVEMKEPGWALEDEAARLDVTATLREVEMVSALQGALTVDPDLPEAHAALADHHREELLAAERAHREADAARAEARLRAHDRGRYGALLRGEGALSLVTDPPGALVKLERYVERGRRLVPEDLGVIGATPLRQVPLQKGSYRLRITAPGRREVKYPVLIERGGHWDGVPPGERDPFPIALPLEEEIGAEDCYVPAGWFWAGGDPDATDGLPARRLWAGGFILGRYPVTVGEYMQFLNDLVASGREEEAWAACPRRELGAVEGGAKRVLLDRDASGRFLLPEDPVWGPDFPVVQIDWHAAMAYVRWLAKKEGAPCRLLHEIEREKAARGVDARRFPWGNHPDATFACVAEGHRDEPLREAVHGHPTDESVYGVRGLAGNVRDWCGNVWRQDGPPVLGGRLVLEAEGASPGEDVYRIVHGGFWASPIANSRSAGRFGSRPSLCRYGVGMRVGRSYPDTGVS